MQQMDYAGIALLAVAGYVAVLSLVRLMRARRDHMLDRFREEVRKEKERQEESRKQELVQQLRRQRSA
jgi:hypothetical protein